jgi:lipopolysaccharide transport system ATP-binding protein
MIKVEGISKKFKLYRSPADRLKEIIFRKQYHKDFVALDNISFEIGAGQTLGIIGQNGAGKSTLLKILSGIVIPDSGTIRIDGKVTGLLELGTGFNAEMTGLENIYMNGTLIGMTKDEIDRKKQTIIDFSELGEFIHEYIKTYSSGMTMRLAFSIAIHADPKCFLVDEALAVGDAYFQQKCMRKIQEFRAGGGSIVFVSHDMNAVRTLCDRALLLDHGHAIEYGETKSVVDFYENSIIKQIHKGESELSIIKGNTEKNEVKSGLDTGEVKLKSIKILNENDEEIAFIESERNVKIVFEIISTKDLAEPHFGLTIRNYLGQRIFQIDTDSMRLKPKILFASQIATITFFLNIPLSPGNYTVSVGVANKGNGIGTFEEYLLFIQDAELLKVTPNPKAILYSGIFNINPRVTIQTNDNSEMVH